MEIIVKIFYSVLLIGFGYLLIRYRRNVHSWTGNWVWAEKYLGSGGTYVALTFFGLFLIFLGAIYPFGGLALLSGK
nr:hypothetical protein [Candidatus Gracilibacteria bacterium]